jgi:bifunctional UDP-N-acetylglucosamine pyrophosphorylase / glucosamine-1-phosphate N-acetyltransferase
MQLSAVILAAGLSKRMKSAKPKVLHNLLGCPMIEYSLGSMTEVCGHRPVIVIGHAAEEVKNVVGERADFALQKELLGTADAVNSAKPLLENRSDYVLVVNADIPLLRTDSIRQLLETQKSNPGPMSLMSFTSAESRGFGRIARSSKGDVLGIIEEKDATNQQLGIHEFNVGVYCFRSDWLWENLQKIELSPSGEYYLTELVHLAVQQELTVRAVTLEDAEEAMGINNRIHLAEAERILRKRVNSDWMLAGVTMHDPERVYIEKDVTIGRDTVLFPETYLQGRTKIGDRCEIGPMSSIDDSVVGDNCKIQFSVLEGAVLEDEVSIGPFARLRKGAHLCKGVHMGNFGEVKNSILGPGVKMGHFSYIGDAEIGENVNIGAGVITCNFDGVHKHKTEIGANAFIGSDTMLRAPIKIGEGAYTGAGSVVTHDVAAHTTVTGVPARPVEKKNKPENNHNNKGPDKKGG